MRRWLSILLLVFMPFQLSWAAVATYCQHESGTRSQHFGHHEHQHQPPASQSGEDTNPKASAALDIADCHFHCQCAAALPAPMGTPVVIGASHLTDWAVSHAIAPVLPQPERPQWTGHA